jgi:hypothetical protein
MSTDDPVPLEDRIYRSLQFALLNPTIVRAAYFGAHRRAHYLREQLRELEIQISQAEAAIAEVFVPAWPPLPSPVRPPTLHHAIRLVLETKSNRWMRTGQLAREIAKRQLYRRRDGLAASTKDVSARVASHPEIFERRGVMVRLRSTSPAPIRIPSPLAIEEEQASPGP